MIVNGFSCSEPAPFELIIVARGGRWSVEFQQVFTVRRTPKVECGNVDESWANPVSMTKAINNAAEYR